MLGLIGLLLAFGLTMAVGRYEVRRALLVDEANAIGTTYLRAQLLPEPVRTDTLMLLERYADDSIDLADSVPDSDQFDAAVLDIAITQRLLWADAAAAVQADPEGTAPRLYIESLNEMARRPPRHHHRRGRHSAVSQTPIRSVPTTGGTVVAQETEGRVDLGGGLNGRRGGCQ